MSKKPTYEELEQRVRELERAEFERKRAGEDLLESREKFREIIEISHDIHYRQDFNTALLDYMSPSMTRTFGYSIDEIMNMNLEQQEKLFHPEDLPGLLSFRNDLIDADAKGQNNINLEFRMLHKSGEVHWINGNYFLTKDESGDPKFIVGVLRDITERKRAEEALRASEEKLKSIIDSAPFGAHGYQLKDDGKLIFSEFNLAAEKILDVKHEQFVDKSIEEAFPNLVDTPIPETYRNVAESGRPYYTEQVDYDEQGIKGAFEVSAVNRGKNQMVAFFRDITERKKAEENLRESEAKFRELAGMLPQIVFETDAKGNLTFVNQNAFDIFGYTKDDFASGLSAIQMIAPKDRELAAERMLQIMMDQSHLTGFEYNAIRKDSTEFPIIIYSTRFLRDGNLAGLRGIIIDITNRKREEQEREKLQAQLIQAQKMEAIGTLAGGIAHNFNNILMGVQGRTSLMMMDKDPSHLDFEHLEEIQAYVKDAVELTKDLMGFARGGKYEIKSTELNALIKYENKMFSRTKKEIQIREKYEKELWTVEVDRGQIQQVFLNLYVNAWQAMPGGGELYIQTENVTLDEQFIKPFEVPPGRYVKILVADTGRGMDESTQEKIFDPFFSTKDTSQGSGLGLASAYGIIKNHGGFINVYSQKGKGTSFNIYLPASDKEVVNESPRPGQPKTQHGEGTILFVDDEDMIIDVGRIMLEKLGYRVLIARNGREALDAYGKQGEQIDLVILDMIMPGLGGGVIFDRLKEVDGNVKVLLSSGYSIDGQANEILDRGCMGFIQKPFTLNELSIKVRETLEET